MTMRIVTCVAAVPNPDKVKWDRFRQLLDVQDAEPVLNPFDRNALELSADLAKQSGSAFEAICVGAGATAALREAAVFGAQRLIAIEDDALEGADECGVAAALSSAVRSIGGADVILCGPFAAAFGSGAVPGLISAHLDASLLVDAVGVQTSGNGISATLLGEASLQQIEIATPVVIAAAPYGIKARAISPLLLVKAAKRAIESMTLAAIACPLPLS
ncbi:MAG TPA: hypothetical protein VEJ20_02780, partial [Candidatus Eremiobacteraceae bacterium]|nr:hypothetical protein [Candidatus Eremiobacteraceae bacterium]